MRKIASLAVAGMVVLALSSSAWAMEAGILKNIEQLADNEIVPLAKEAIIVNTVKEANINASKSQDEIISLDKKWRAAGGMDAWISGFLSNPCAEYLKEFKDKAKKDTMDLYSEIFVMDKQGNIVAETDKTSDYWQGDEDKFIKSFADGKGDIFIDEPSFDESTQTYLVQVSVPVLDPDTGEAIGAMTAGINLEALNN